MSQPELIEPSAAETSHDSVLMLQRRIVYGSCIGLGIALLAVVLAYGLRDDLNTAFLGSPFWMKWTYALSMGLIAYILCERFTRPGSTLDFYAGLPLIPIALLTVLAVRTQLQLPEDLRMGTWLGGRSALYTPWHIGLLSLPAFAALCRGLRPLPITQMRTIACCVGLLSGAIGAFAYTLSCRESSVSFVATWYTLGMLLPAAAGALFGNALLRRR